MGVNAANVKGGGNYDPMEPDTYQCRLVLVADMGVQPGGTFQGEQKPPRQKIALGYEFTDEFMKDEDGEPDVDKPRWLTETIPLFGLGSDRAKSTLRYKALDPENEFEGDFGALLNKAVNVTVVHNVKGDRVYENIQALSSISEKKAKRVGKLVNKPILFDLDDPSVETFETLPAWLQKQIKAGPEFEGSEMDKLLGKDPTPTQECPSEDDDDDDGKPY